MGVLDGKVAIVTGPSKGIGAAIAIGLGKAGASVVVNYALGRDGAGPTAEAIRPRGGGALTVSEDVSKALGVAMRNKCPALVKPSQFILFTHNESAGRLTV